MATFAEIRLGASRPTDTSNATLYTVPASTTVVVKNIQICNTTATAATCRVFLTPSGGTADETTAILYDFNIPANQAINWELWQVLAAAATVVVRSGTASALTFTASGVTIV